MYGYLFMAGKLVNTDAKMYKMNTDILGLSKGGWNGSRKQKTNCAYTYYSGDTDPEHRYGVVVPVSSSVEKCVLDFVPINNRVKVLKLQITYQPINII